VSAPGLGVDGREGETQRCVHHFGENVSAFTPADFYVVRCGSLLPEKPPTCVK